MATKIFHGFDWLLCIYFQLHNVRRNSTCWRSQDTVFQGSSVKILRPERGYELIVLHTEETAHSAWSTRWSGTRGLEAVELQRYRLQQQHRFEISYIASRATSVHINEYLSDT